MKGGVSHAECQEWANGSAIWVTSICGQFPCSARIVDALTLVRCVRFLDLPKQVKQKDVKLMSTFSYDCTAFCSYLLDRESFIKTFFFVAVFTLVRLVWLEKGHYCYIMSHFPVIYIEMFIFCSACRCTFIFKRLIMSFNSCGRTNKYTVVTLFLFLSPFICRPAKKMYGKVPKPFFIYVLLARNDERLWNWIVAPMLTPVCH